VLANFRDWLRDLPPAQSERAQANGSVDMQTLIGHFIALRHEVNLQTKSSRSTLEQNAAALQQLERAVAALQAKAPEPDETLKPLLKAVIDVYDALALAVRQVERQRDKIFAGLDTLIEAASIEEPPVVLLSATAEPAGFWQRLFGVRQVTSGSSELVRWRERTLNKMKEREERVREASHFLRQALDGLLTGYTMSLNRIDRILPQFGVEAMECAGERFDPELMEVIEVVADSGRPGGEVIEEVRRGYIWNEAVFRYAQVRVAK
jgi:molecular chaperone GrpE